MSRSKYSTILSTTISPDQKSRIFEAAEAADMSVSEFVRMAMDAYLKASILTGHGRTNI